uniref:Carboxylic ester hydrolase n=1 Tax=Hemiscolopendra marginata TaxID=943146 RepID=A0A646QFK8_9MYRI
MRGNDVLWLGSLLLLFCSEMVSGKEGVVFLAQGRIQGTQQFSENKEEFYAYYGIPYAQPPVKKLRFKDPIKHPGWEDGVRMGKIRPAVCPQWGITHVIGDENCLFLNVFTSRLRQAQLRPDEPLLPVMVYIHGGGFYRGGMNIYGPEKLMDDHKVLVFVQYRLGVLGFLCTEDENFSGNYGMMDIILALQWVQENIGKFGGDKNSVTIFGNSAGGAAVSMMIASPLAKGLFSAAIVQSGSALCDWAIEENPSKFADSLAEALDCPHENRTAMFECVRKKRTKDIIEQQTRIQKRSFLSVIKPVIDKHGRSDPFLPAHPRELYEGNKIHHVPLIAGVTTDEGLSPLLWFLIKQHTLLRNGTRFDHDYMPKMLNDMMDNRYDARSLWDVSKSIYFRDVSFEEEEEIIPPLVELIGDAMFYYCVDELLRLHSSKVPGKTFAYVFGIRNYASYDDHMDLELREITSRTSLYNSAVKHADELPYLFTMNGSNNAIRTSSKGNYNMAKLWSNFAVQEEPTPNSVSNHKVPLWPPYSKKNQVFYNLQQVFSTLPSGFRHRELATWRHLLSEAEAAAEAIRLAELNKDPFQPYRAVMWAMIAVAAFLILVVLVLAGILVGTGKKQSESIKPISSYEFT